MKHRNNVLTATLVALAFAFAPVVQAGPRLDGGPTRLRVNDVPSPDGGPVSVRATPAPRPDSGLVSLAANEASRATPTPRARPTPAPRPDSALVSLAANEGINADSEASSANSVSAEGRANAGYHYP
jgi:hypothetical protein